MLACAILISGCPKKDATPTDTTAPGESQVQSVQTPEGPVKKSSLHVRPDVPENGDVVVLMTGDMHSLVDKNFSFGGVYEIRYQMELKGDTVLLVDDGDAIQGAPLGFDTKGEAVIDLMNELGYDVAIPGVHEFHYGMDRFFELVNRANFEYISCNFVKDGQLVLKPYVIKEACGKKIAFVGVTTPRVLTQMPAEYFHGPDGSTAYGFMQDSTGDIIVRAVQNSIDKARSEGADYVIVMGHFGKSTAAAPWVYSTITTKIRGCDVYFDGYSHDVAADEYQDADGNKRMRVSAGSGLRGLGWVRFSAKDGAVTAGVHSWQNNEFTPIEVFDIENPMSKRIDEAMKEFAAGKSGNG